MNSCKYAIRISNKKDNNEFANWHKADSIFDLTCRPISKDNKRIPPDNNVYRLSFFIEGSDKTIGRFSYFDVNSRNRSAEFGYILNPEYRGMGLGKVMLTEGFNFVFSKTNLNKLYCQTASYNEPSIKLLINLGLNLDGKLRQHHEKNGTLYDDHIYSILRSEWEKSNSA